MKNSSAQGVALVLLLIPGLVAAQAKYGIGFSISGATAPSKEPQVVRKGVSFWLLDPSQGGNLETIQNEKVLKTMRHAPVPRIDDQ